MKSINPNSGRLICEYRAHTSLELDQALDKATKAFKKWRNTSFKERAGLFRRAAQILRERKAELAKLMANEMGKVLADGSAEIEKCATCCEFFAENAERFLKNQTLESDAKESFVSFEPLGVVLAVMPWNFPFWQVFRFAVPSLMAGNVGVLKHASNVTACGLAIEDIFEVSGFPEGVFKTILIPGSEVDKLIRNPNVNAVTLTGSTPAGQSVASAAGSVLKKTVLELGGSDPYLILEDTNLEQAAQICVRSRLINGDQSCIAAKRFIAVESVFDRFQSLFLEEMKSKKFGDPFDPASDFGPLARIDLRNEVHEQVTLSVSQGAKLLVGGVVPKGVGAHYPPTVLTDVQPGMTAFDEEIFGPVASLIRATGEEEAITLANQSRFGLGAAVFTKDETRAKKIASHLDAGSVFINTFVKSDVRLPFGGIKDSGYGRELSHFGIKEFVNIKTVYLAQ